MARIKTRNISSSFMRTRNLFWRVVARPQPRHVGRLLFGEQWAGRLLSWLPWERIIAYPPFVDAELTVDCNLKCPMCLHQAMPLGRGFMDEHLFRNIVDQISCHRGVLLILCGRGESMLHPKWEEYVVYAKRAGVSPMLVVTNGTLLNRDKASLLVDLGVEQVLVAVDGASKETYEAMRVGANFEQVLGNIHRLIELRARASTRKPRILVRMIVTPDTQHEVDAFTEYWQGRLSEYDEIKIGTLITWAPIRDAEPIVSQLEASEYASVRRQPQLMAPCTALWKGLLVYHNGMMSACCLRDSNTSLLSTNANTDSIADAWRCPALKKARRLHLLRRKLDIPVCRRCVALMYAAQVQQEKADPDALRAASCQPREAGGGVVGRF